MHVRQASAEDREALSRLAFRSKAHWGYSIDFMEASHAELEVPEALLRAGLVFTAEHDGERVGFYCLEPGEAQRVELAHCFVDPDHIGRGVGRRLMEHAVERARMLGFKILEIQSDPHARDFYCNLGARVVGLRASTSIPGRFLPLLELQL